MDGIYLVDKPFGWTSFDVVAKIRGTLRQVQKANFQANSQSSAPSPKVKVGHTGTLDPLATGLMVVVVGTYCKRADEFTKLDKTYEVTMKLGQTSTTGDEEGVKTNISTQQPLRSELDQVIEQFIGAIRQTPPAHSAIKVNGQRAYKLAREGKEVNLEPRQVMIYEITDVVYRYPLVNFTAKVSSGTYIRSLVQDIGECLKTGAYMSGLRRTKVGSFSLNGAIRPDLSGAELAKKLVVC